MIVNAKTSRDVNFIDDLYWPNSTEKLRQIPIKGKVQTASTKEDVQNNLDFDESYIHRPSNFESFDLLLQIFGPSNQSSPLEEVLGKITSRIEQSLAEEVKEASQDDKQMHIHSEKIMRVILYSVFGQIPLHKDEHGVIRVSGTRVTLDTIINYYLQGESPEDLHEGFPTVPLSDIYAVIAYYLAHREELDVYLKRRDEEAERTRQGVEANYTPKQQASHERLLRLVEEKRRERGD